MPPRLMTGHRPLICLLLVVTTACSSSGSEPTGEMATLSSGTATLSWDPNSESDLEGYKIYLATDPGRYGAPIAILNKDVTNYTVTGLETGTTYFFTVTAYNLNGAESPFSNEVSKTIH